MHLVATNLNTRSSEVYSRDKPRTCRSRKPSDDQCLLPFSSLQFEKPTKYSSVAACWKTMRFVCLTAQNTLQSRIALDTSPPPKAYSEAKREMIENFFDYGCKFFQTQIVHRSTATSRAATGIARFSSKRSAWAQPSLISTTNPSATSRPPGGPVPKSISIGNKRTPSRQPGAGLAFLAKRLAKWERMTTCRPSNPPQTHPPAPVQPTRQTSCDPDAPDRRHAPSPS